MPWLLALSHLSVIRCRSALRVAAVAVLAGATVPHPGRAQDELRNRVDTTLAFNKGGLVDLGLVSGDIVVTGWTRPEAQVVARVREGVLETTLTANRISIHTRSRRGRQGEGRFELHVPIGTRVQASTVSGDVRITATAGEVQVTSTSGNVEVIDATDRLSISTVSGDIHASRVRGNTRIHTTSGDLELDDLTGDLTVGSVSAEVKLHRITASHVRVETVSGDISYGGSVESNGSYEFSAHSGGVVLQLPQAIGATLDLQTYSGEISSSFPLTLQPGDRSRSRKGRKMQFTIGNGGAGISVQTFSGDITIERGGRSSREE